MNEKLSIPEEVKHHPAWLRLERYKGLKLVQIVLAASIPIVALIDASYTKYIVAIFGALIAILESIQQLYQFHTLWTDYRSTAEHLKYEKYLFLSFSGPYRELNQDEALLLIAERIEEHLSKEHAKWIDTSKMAAPKVSQPEKTA